MKPKLALWMLTFFVPAASAADITCNAGAASIPFEQSRWRGGCCRSGSPRLTVGSA